MSGRRQIGNTFTVNTIDDPVDAFVVDLDNEMTSIVADENGDTTSAVSLSPLVRAYYGTQSVIASCTVTASADDADVSVSYNSTTHRVNISISAETNVNDVVTVTVTVVHATYGTRTATFVISKVKDGTSAFIQELLPSLDEISFARQADKSLSPASRNLTLSFKKTKGNETTIQSLSEAGLTVRWSTSSMPSTVSSGSGWGQGTSVSGITWDNVTMQVANSVDVSNIYIACFNSGGTLVDRETIPIIKDGQHGDDAPAAYASPEKISVPCSSNGDVKAEQTTSVLFSLKVGTHSATVTSVSCDSYPTNVVVTGVAAYAQTIKVPATQTASGISSGCTFTVTGTYGCKTFSAKVTVALIGTLQGSQGVRGKVGRFFYYEGEWSDFAPTSEFEVSDAQAPYFHYDNKYWVFNPETNGTYTKQDMGTPSPSSSNWKLMTNDFKYIITEAMFSNFAKLASAIFSGDWMLSQYGVPSRVISTTEKYLVYMCVKVDGQYPVSELATLLDDADLWDEYKGYGYSDSELETVADICKWAVSAMPSNSDDVRYNAIQTISNTSYQLFGLNQSNLFSVFEPNISFDFLRGEAYLNDCNVKGNFTGRVSTPFTRIKNSSDWNGYGVITTDDYGHTRHYLFINKMPTWNVQIEYMSGNETPYRRLILPVITQETLGVEIKIVNVSGDTITVEGKPEKSTYMSYGSYLLDGIQTTGYSNDQRTVEMDNQTMLKFVSVEIPTQYGEYGWITVGEPQTIKSQV